MTWFIDLGRFPVIATVDHYVEGSPPVRRSFGRQPLSQEEKDQLPSGAKLILRPNCNTIQHIATDRKFLILSDQALGVLREFQPDGWEAFPVELQGADVRKLFGATPYHLLNLYPERNIVDLRESNLRPRVLKAGATTITSYRPSDAHRQIAVKSSLVGQTALWLGADYICNFTYFVSDGLRDAWCSLGIPPNVFEPCIDV
jgi:hypothetical protein